MKKLFVLFAILVTILTGCDSIHTIVQIDAPTEEVTTTAESTEEPTTETDLNFNSTRDLFIIENDYARMLSESNVVSRSDFEFVDSYPVSYTGSNEYLNFGNIFSGSDYGKLENFFFKDEQNVVGIKFPENLEIIPAGICTNLKSLKAVITGTGTKAVDKMAFNGCENLECIILNDGIEAISIAAFANCTSLKFIIFPSSINSIAEYAFYNSNPDLIVVCRKDSYAEDYAISRNMNYYTYD